MTRVATERKMVVARGGREGKRAYCDMGMRCQLHDINKFKRSAVQRCAYSQQHCIRRKRFVKRVDLILHVLAAINQSIN